MPEKAPRHEAKKKNTGSDKHGRKDKNTSNPERFDQEDTDNGKG